jgi:sialate O-acetylesterase
MAGTVDIGDMADIHPVKKREVGERLAGLALRDAYGMRDNGAGSPVFWRSSRGEESVSIEFRAMNGKYLDGLEARGNKGFPQSFVATWRNGQQEELKGRVDGNGVLLDCPDAKELASISYAFKQEAGGNLFNSRGEPAIPFKLRF